ncbi:MAG TPA: nucleotide exchange factor GrpE [Candidatus Nitrosopolaris sp.]|nr:nucleotide exchange factor GrpE [Candidatus Nitrosopolaris sp.]
MEEEFNEVEQVEQNESRIERDEILTMKEELAAAKEELSFVKEELRKTRESSNNNLNKLKYMVADFDNYRKQMDKQVGSKIEENKAELMLRFLNIRDDYVRAVEIAKQSKVEPVVAEGLDGILKNFDHLLKSEGVIEIETVETPFDPNVHDAIGFSYRDDLPESTVTAEIRKGYMLDTKVLRPSLVEISKKIVKNTVNDTEKAEKGTEN